MKKANVSKVRQKRLEVLDFAIKKAFVIHPAWRTMHELRAAIENK